MNLLQDLVENPVVPLQDLIDDLEELKTNQFEVQNSFFDDESKAVIVLGRFFSSLTSAPDTSNVITPIHQFLKDCGTIPSTIMTAKLAPGTAQQTSQS